MAKKNGAARRAPRAAPPDPGAPRVEYVDLDELLGRKWEGNPKGHDLDFLGEAFQANGFAELPHLDEGTGKMVAGHGRLEKLRELRDSGSPAPERIRVEGGRWLVPVVRGMRYRDALKHLLASNRGVELGGWENRDLAAILSRLGSEEAAFLGTGFAPGDFAMFMADGAGEGDDPNEHWRGMPGFEHGDLSPWKSIHVHFKSREDYEAFARLVRQPLTEDTRFIWYPPAEIGRTADKRYAEVPGK